MSFRAMLSKFNQYFIWFSVEIAPRSPRVLTHNTFFFFPDVSCHQNQLQGLIPCKLDFCSHLSKTVSGIKNKLTPRLLHMFRRTIFGYILDVKLVFSGPLCHYILLREVKKRRDNIISFKLYGEKVSFGQEDFDIITGLRYMPRCEVQFEQGKTLRLRKLYLGDRTNMNGSELNKDYLTLQFKSDEDA